MEFYEKLQNLRKQRGLTQQELAEKLYVSRTAVSKWESGKGYPSIDSLKVIADFFSVTVDALLSSSEMLTAAEENQKRTEKHYRDLTLGLLDLCMLLLLFLPFFGSNAGDAVRAVSLLSLGGIPLYLKAAYLSVVIAAAALGVLMLALQSCSSVIWIRSKDTVSSVLSIAAVLLFTVSRQPYAAVFAFSLLTVKAVLLIKRV